jgi:hypothetical protein
MKEAQACRISCDPHICMESDISSGFMLWMDAAAPKIASFKNEHGPGDALDEAAIMQIFRFRLRHSFEICRHRDILLLVCRGQPYCPWRDRVIFV